MKRLFYLAVLVFMVTTASAQSFETPICYALRGADATLKYRFKYDEGKFYTCFRIYEKPGNALKPGDKIIMENVDEEVVEYQITEQVIHDSGDNDFYQVETDYNQLVLLQRKLKKITLIRENVAETPKLTAYCKTCTVNGAKEVVCNATRIEKEKERAKLLEAKAAAIKAAINIIRIEKAKLPETKAAVIEIEKTIGAHLTNDVSYYNRFFVGYAPTQSKGNKHYEGLTFGYTGGLRLSKDSKAYLEFGVQFDELPHAWVHTDTESNVAETISNATKAISNANESLTTANNVDISNPTKQIMPNLTPGTDNNFSISIPIAITPRFELGYSGATLSPFLGPIFKFNVQERGSNVFQVGAQGGINLDYKHLYLGLGYHIEFWTKESDHTRGLYIRLGYTF
mgnify:CR=1 FL=1